MKASALIRSQEQPSQTPYELDVKTDLPVFGVAGGLALVPVFLNNVKQTCPCSPSDVNGFDSQYCYTAKRHDR